jgi:hypothetical protein
MAMEQEHNSNNPASQKGVPRYPPKRYSPLNSPDSILDSSTDPSPTTPRTPRLNIAIPKSDELSSIPANDAKRREPKAEHDDEEDRRYWEEEEDDGYWGELDEDEDDEKDEDLEETYRGF